MKILSCHVEGFGNIVKKDYTFDNLTVFMRENGAGKTTLASFIKAMFYGLPSVRAGGNFNERQRFCPFDGSKFGGNLTFEKDGKTYRIERFFDKKSETRDELDVFVGGKRVPALDIGRETFGLDMPSFTRTAFITSEICESGAGGDINKMLNRDAGAGSESDFGAAVAAIDLRRKELKADRGKKGLLFDKRDERQSLVYEIEQLKERERELGARYAERAALAEAVENARPEAGTLPTEGELDFVAEKYAEIERLSALTESAAVENKSAGKGKTGYILIALAAVLIAAGAGLCALTLAGIAVIAAGVLAGAGAVFALSRARAKGKKESQAAGVYAEDIARLKGAIEGVFERYNMPKPQDIRGAIEDLRQKRRQLDGILSGFGEELSARRRKLGMLDSAIAAEEAELELLPDKLSRLESVDEELNYLTRKHETLVLTAEYLKQADRAIKDRYVSPVRGRFEFYAEEIKAALGQKMTMDTDFSVSFEKNGSIMSEKHLSAGQRAVVSLCLRLALIDNMYKDEKPFIIMDDPFVNLDGANFEGCKRVIRALSKQIQIIYFTCHDSRRV